MPVNGLVLIFSGLCQIIHKGVYNLGLKFSGFQFFWVRIFVQYNCIMPYVMLD